jgi:hypothetical protein
VAVTVLFDLSKAYEHILFNVLRGKAAKFGFPLRLLRLLISMYTIPRIVMLAGVATGAFWPLRAVVAGCSFADLMMRVYIMDILDCIAEVWPKAHLGNVVDTAGPGISQHGEHAHPGCR